MMWFFKKKKVEKEVKPKYEVKEDRFTVEVNKDKDEYMIKVYDDWSDMLYDNTKFNCQTSTMQNVIDYKNVLENVERMKRILRDEFIKGRKRQCKIKKKKKVII